MMPSRPCVRCGEPEVGAQGLCLPHLRELKAAVAVHESELPTTPREAALRLIRYYVYRGDSEESLRYSHMGHYGSDMRASIGGSLVEDGARRHVPSTRILVREVAGTPCQETFDLHTLYVELQREQAGVWQASLFGEAVAG